jgi:hypothetical protein
MRVSFTVISKMKTERGLALQDLLTGAFDYVDTIELKPHARIYLLDHLASTEYEPFLVPHNAQTWLTQMFGY